MVSDTCVPALRLLLTRLIIIVAIATACLWHFVLKIKHGRLCNNRRSRLTDQLASILYRGCTMELALLSGIVMNQTMSTTRWCKTGFDSIREM